MYEDMHYDYSPDSVYNEYKGITTNPCVAGDTIINTDKGNLQIKEVIERLNNGEEFNVLSYNINDDNVEYQKITKGLLTRKNANIIELETDDGEKIKLTPDHKVYTENRGWIEASKLNKNDILLKI
jgi:ribonucleoside-diphosphate reductase alpha chain